MTHTPLVIAFTPNYFIPAATTLQSIISSSKSSKFEVICLVSVDIPEIQKDLLNEMSNGQLAFKYINLAGRLNGLYIDPRYSEAASFRLLLPELLPEYDKVAYIDCDVIVRNDIAALYENTDLGDNLLGAVYEAPIENQSERWKSIGCDPLHYFNSGFLLMNLKKMREEHISELLIKELDTDYLEFPDQDALNKVCQGRVLSLSPIYNGIRTFFLPQYKNEFVKQYNLDVWKEVQKHGTIHYTGGKPWNLFTVKFGEWWKCYYTLPGKFHAEWVPNKKMERLYAIYKTTIGRWIIDGIQAAYRSLKY